VVQASTAWTSIPEGQVMGLVGESGCGKSVTSLSIMRLLGGSGKIVEGEVWLKDRNLVTLPEDEMVKLRGGELSMIFPAAHQLPESHLSRRRPGGRGVDPRTRM
jgi:ABC-type dipeptide/oligopeptide/nickel transport system ATPase component